MGAPRQYTGTLTHYPPILIANKGPPLLPAGLGGKVEGQAVWEPWSDAPYRMPAAAPQRPWLPLDYASVLGESEGQRRPSNSLFAQSIDCLIVEPDMSRATIPGKR